MKSCLGLLVPGWRDVGCLVPGPIRLHAMSLRIKNPHSILAAIEQRPADVIEVRLSPKGVSDAWEDVERLARELGSKLCDIVTRHRELE